MFGLAAFEIRLAVFDRERIGVIFAIDLYVCALREILELTDVREYPNRLARYVDVIASHRGINIYLTG